MFKCNKYQSMFDKALNDDLSPEDFKTLNNHLDSCENCSKEFGELENALSIMMKRERREPTGEFMNNLWENIEPQLEKKNKPVFKLKDFWLNFKDSVYLNFKYTYQLSGGLAILIIGIFIGKFFVTPTVKPQPENILPENINVEQVALQARADRYIDRSKILLLGLMNFDPSEDIEAISLPHQKRISDELISEAADLKDKFNKPSQRQLKELIADLEVILLQIANLETEFDLSGIELVKNGVDRRGIFLKINIREMLGNKSETRQSSGNQKSLKSKKI